MANGRGRLPCRQQGVPPEEASSAVAEGVGVGALDVAGLQRGDDGDGAGAQGGWQGGAAPVQAGAGHFGPALPARQVAEGGPGQQSAHSLAGRVVPAGRGEEKRRLRMTVTSSDLAAVGEVFPPGTNFTYSSSSFSSPSSSSSSSTSSRL